MQHISVRQARTFIEVADCGSVTKAAQALNKAQTSVTKTISELEALVEFTLFDRSSRGVKLSTYGETFYPQAVAAAKEFEKARGLVPPVLFEASPGAARFFRMDVSETWLNAFIATVETRSVAASADQLGITSAAISTSLRKLEDMLGISLFDRTSVALEPTAFSRDAVRHLKLARYHLRQGVDEMASVDGLTRGHIVIGTLPFVRTILLPEAIIQLLTKYPALDVSTTESPYDDLITGLRCGDIDVLLGALRGAEANADVMEETLLTNDLSIIVRAGHPLLSKETLCWADLLEYDWVLPRHGTPTRELITRFVLDNRLAEPDHILETSSFVILRGLVMESNRITVLSRHQCLREESAGMLACLDYPLPNTERDIGITTRSEGSLSPAARLFIEAFRKVSQDYA